MEISILLNLISIVGEPSQGAVVADSKVEFSFICLVLGGDIAVEGINIVEHDRPLILFPGPWLKVFHIQDFCVST